jgi:multidrug efflux pump subunit AcrA (membrane-fusion protein)
MNQLNRVALILAPILCLTLAGCHPRTTNAAKDADAEKVSLFQKGKGVCLPDEMRKELGVEVVEVVERPLPRHLMKMAQVYRAARGGEPAGASVLLTAEEAKEVKPGLSVALCSTEAHGIQTTGTVARIDEYARPVLGQVEILTEFPDSERRFPVGAFLLATFVTREAKPVFVVPETALLTAAHGCFVYTVNGTHLTRTPVKSGAVSDGFMEIQEGLYAGDSIAAKGIENLWLVELSALKGGTPCCPVPKKNASK